MNDDGCRLSALSAVSLESALAKAETVATEMEGRRLKAAANCLREGIGKTTTYLLPGVSRRGAAGASARTT